MRDKAEKWESERAQKKWETDGRALEAERERMRHREDREKERERRSARETIRHTDIE